MDKKIKTEWLKRLRSGKYKQCTRVLHDGVGYCCLGVLHKILYKPKVPKLWDESDPPPRFKMNRDTAAILGKMNDEGQTFSQIADYIEANL